MIIKKLYLLKDSNKEVLKFLGEKKGVVWILCEVGNTLSYCW